MQFLIFIFIFAGSFSCTPSLMSPGESLAFFSESLTLEMRATGRAAQLHGRFISDPRMVEANHLCDVSLLEACAALNLSLADSEIVSGSTGSRQKKKFVQKLKSSLGSLTREKLQSSLENFHCRHAVKSAGFEHLGEDLTVKMTEKVPENMQDHLEIVAQLKDFSFLTVELAGKLYANKNQLLTPFSVQNLVESVTFEVLKELIEMWEWDLRTEDARAVLDLRPEIAALMSSEPRFWLLWRRSARFPIRFPMELLLKELREQGISGLNKYTNLILAFVFESETMIFSSMSRLEFLHADFHKNDAIEEKYMTAEMIGALDSRKWDLWFEAGKSAISGIEELMKMRKQLIGQLTALKTGTVPDEMIIYVLLPLLKTPLNAFSRSSFLKSRDLDELIKASDNYGSAAYFADYSVIVRPFTLFNKDYWTVLWKQLQVFEIELVYDEELAKDPLICQELTERLVAICYSSRKKTPARSSHWLVQVFMLLIEDRKGNLKDSTKIAQTIYLMLADKAFEFLPFQLDQMRMLLHPEGFEVIFRLFEGHELVEKFRLAPETLSRGEISDLIQNHRDLIKFSKSNVMKLRWLDSFSASDLIEFFPLSVEYHLDRCEALYTVDPEALAGYLEAVEGGVNYPEQLIWWIHPRAWDNLRVVDALSEIVPFSVFVKWPKEVEALNLARIVPDIMARILRRPPGSSVPRMILKWLVQMEWFFLQTHVESLFDDKINIDLMKIVTEMISVEGRARRQLVGWLKGNETIADAKELIELLERSPLSQLRSSICYDVLINATIGEIRKTNPAPLYTGIHTQFTDFTSKKFLQIRQSDLETSVEGSVTKCLDLILKHLGLVEGVLWMNRLTVVNIPQFSIYLLNPIPVSLISRFYKNCAAPIHDLQILFNLLCRHGYSNGVVAPGNGPYLEISAGALELSEKNAMNYERFLDASREIILEHEIKTLRELKAKK